MAVALDCVQDVLIVPLRVVGIDSHGVHAFLRRHEPWVNLAGSDGRLLGVRKSAASAKITGRPIMTPEEGERLGKDGTIFVLDLSHIDGQHAAEALECEHEQVAIRLQQRMNNLPYLLVLQPKVGQTVPMLVEPAALPEAAIEMIARSKYFGEAFGIVVVPRSEHITSLFASLTETACT